MSAQHTPTAALAVMVKLASLGGVVLEQYNQPRSTGTIRSHLRGATTAQVRNVLRKAELAGDVECCANPRPGWNPNAADHAELWWRLSSSALAKAGAA